MRMTGFWSCMVSNLIQYQHHRHPLHDPDLSQLSLHYHLDEMMQHLFQRNHNLKSKNDLMMNEKKKLWQFQHMKSLRHMDELH